MNDTAKTETKNPSYLKVLAAIGVSLAAVGCAQKIAVVSEKPYQTFSSRIAGISTMLATLFLAVDVAFFLAGPHCRDQNYNLPAAQSSEKSKDLNRLC